LHKVQFFLASQTALLALSQGMNDNFPRALRSVVSELEWTGLTLSKAARMTESKVSRLLNGKICCDGPTLGRILSALKNREHRYKLVINFLQDQVPRNAMSCVAFSPVSESSSRARGQSALRGLTEAAAESLHWLAVHHPSVIEDVLPGIARNLGWQPESKRS
jgi:hypothetical protein